MTECVVRVAQGQLQGADECTKNGFHFRSFLGIPYAKPPLGELRFVPPQRAEDWNGIRDATKEGDECQSFDPMTHALVGSEDCLYLNVYTPSSEAAAPRAVMVWIHGGGYIFGSSKRMQYGPEFLIERDVVLVTLNYRLGALGFLCLEDSSLGIHGNAGMKDQVLALKWVQENIHAFGGDADNVTIFGESAGGGSVHLHTLSPMSKGLFHRAIIQSGSALCPWSYGQANGLILADLLGKPAASEADALQILKDANAGELLQAQLKFPDPLTPSTLRLVSPVVETPHGGERFLPDKPINILRSGNFNRVPLLMGYNSEEGLLYKILNPAPTFKFEDIQNAIPHTLGIPFDSDKSKEVARRICEFYYGGEEPSEANKQTYFKILSDSAFLRGIFTTVEEVSKRSPHKLYFYRLSLDCNLNQFKRMLNMDESGVCHAEDLFYLFYHTMLTPAIEEGSVEALAIERLTKWWSNFAKCGDPNGDGSDPVLACEWPTLDADTMQCLDIDTEIGVVNWPDEKYMKFWQSIEEYAKL